MLAGVIHHQIEVEVKNISILVLALSMSLTAGCAVMADKEKMVLNRAHFDLNCENINVVELGNKAYGATGCDQKATYLVLCGGPYTAQCQAVLNSVNANELQLKN
jgi:hypothetical protein